MMVDRGKKNSTNGVGWLESIVAATFDGGGVLSCIPKRSSQ